ncbi:MAG: cupin domain-containing protein [Eubacteriales bacterium]|nr:cupin domain-containing protein [Eubacteriales bacterium]
MESKVVLYRDVPVQELGGGVTRRVLAYLPGEMVVEVRFAPGAQGAAHSHPHTQCTYVVHGEFAFTIGSETFIVHSGDTLAFAPNETHGCVCDGGGVLIDVFTPMREDFI